MEHGGKRDNAGRKEGSRNRKSLELETLLQKKFPNYDPVISMVEIANDKKVDMSLRLAAHKEIAKYLRPQLKAIELTGQGGKDLVKQYYKMSDGSVIEF